MIEELQPEGKIQAGPVVVEAVSSGPSEKERGQDHPPSLARGKSQEERFDELKRFTPRRMNLLSRFTEISEKKSRDQASPSSSKPFLDSPEGGKVCRTCQEPRGDGRKLRSCSFCSTVVYCGEECQRKDWPNHKKDCWIVPGPGYKPKRLLKPVLVQEEPLSEEEVKTPAKATAGGSSTHKIGIQNRGNTCYLNSTVQALLGLPMLVTDAVNLKFALEKLEVSTEVSRLVAPFTAICQAQTRADVARTNVNAMRLKRDMEQLDSQFAGNKMQDANEFLCRFLDELKENIGKIYSENGSPTELVVDDDRGKNHRLTNLVDTNFQYERQETFACCACGHRSHVKHSDVNFFCDLSGEHQAES